MNANKDITSTANGQNGTPKLYVKIHCHFVHLPFGNFRQL